MALILDDRKLLIPGVHEASIGEVEEQFARFQKSDRRIRLFRKPDQPVLTFLVRTV